MENVKWKMESEESKVETLNIEVWLEGTLVPKDLLCKSQRDHVHISMFNTVCM